MASLSASDTARDTFITGAQNLHAIEKQATQLIERQLERVASYPQVVEQLQLHFNETQRQIERLDSILESFGTSRSVLKDTVTSIMGNVAAIAHAPAGDEILKNHFANCAFENYEIAAYNSLIAMGEAIGLRDVALLQQSLSEEQRMSGWLHDNTRTLTTMYLEREAAGQKADR